MKNKLKSPVGLNPGGIGPKIFRNTMPFIILAIASGYFFPNTCSFQILFGSVIRMIGWAMLASGIIAYLLTMKQFLKEFSRGQLITTGIFGLSRNPLYASWILFILPGIALVTNNWAFVISGISLYVFFRINIKEEEESLFKIFGDEYLKYKQRVNLLMFWPNYK